MRYVKGILFSLSLLFLFTQCGERYKTFAEVVLTAKNEEVSPVDTMMTDSVGGFRFSRLNKSGNTGLACYVGIEPKLQNKKLCITFKGRCRSNFAQSGGTISMSVNGEKNNEMLSWRAVLLKYHMVDINQWCTFRDSIIFPPKIDGKVYKTISVMAFLGGTPGENFDIDTLTVIYKVVK